MPKPKGLRHKWLAGSRSSCQRPGCTWSRDRGYVPARYFQTDPKHPLYFGGGTTEAPVCEGRLPGEKPPGDLIVEIGPTLASFDKGGGAR